MIEGPPATEGLLGWARLGVTLLAAGFLPPFLIVWLMTSRSRNQLLAEELGIEVERTWADVLEPIAFAGAVGVAWVLMLIILLKVVSGFVRLSDARALEQRRASDRELARDARLPADAWGAAVLRRRTDSTEPVAIDERDTVPEGSVDPDTQATAPEQPDLERGT